MESKFLYLDESGDDGYPEPHGKSESRYFVYAGAIVDAEQNLELKEGVEYILSYHFDTQGLKRPEELHYGALINERGAYNQLEGIQFKELADDVFELITQVEPTIVATVMDKSKQFEEYEDPAHPKSYSFRWTVERFQYYLEKENNAGMVIADAEEGQIDTRIQNLLNDAKHEGISIIKDKGSRIPRIMDSVALTPSELSPGIQIADFIAYSVFSKYNRDKGDRFEEISHLLRSPPEVDFEEPSVIPT